MQQVGKQITSKDFIGREKELARLIEYIKMGQLFNTFNKRLPSTNELLNQGYCLKMKKEDIILQIQFWNNG